MNPLLEELISLWDKETGSVQVSAAESARLKTLLRDPELVEQFSDWQASQASAEPSHSLNAGDWSRLDKRVLKGYRKSVRSWWAKPGLWLATGSLAVLAAGLFLAYSPSAPQAKAPAPRQEEEKGFRLESLPERETTASRPASSVRPASKPLAPSTMSVAKVIKVVVQRQTAGRVTVLVKDSRGAVLRHLYDGMLKQGRWTLEWDGRDDAGKHVNPGRYRVQLDSDAGTQGKEVEVFGRLQDK